MRVKIATPRTRYIQSAAYLPRVHGKLLGFASRSRFALPSGKYLTINQRTGKQITTAIISTPTGRNTAPQNAGSTKKAYHMKENSRG